MLKIKTKTELLDFKGVAITQGGQTITVGDAIALVLGGKTTNPILGYILGKKFANDEMVELKAEDEVFLKKSLEENDIWTSIVTGQLLTLFETNDKN